MINKKLGLITLLAGFAAGEIMASNTLTNYTTGDVLVCFRNGGANDLVVDAGPISTLVGAAHNQVIHINQYSSAQLNAAVGGSDAVTWSAFTSLADYTLYVTQARSDLNAQTDPYPRNNAANQKNTAVRMATIPTGAAAKFSYNGLNIGASVIEPDAISAYTLGSSYANALLGATGGRFNGTFAGDPENTTLAGFSTSSTVVRSDFFQMTPSSSLGNYGTYLGYFEFASDGTMTYVAYPTALPVIDSFTRSGNTATINYVTGTYGTYTLRASSNLTTPVSSWTPVATLSTGDTSEHTVTDTDSSPAKFYIITGQ